MGISEWLDERKAIAEKATGGTWSPEVGNGGVRLVYNAKEVYREHHMGGNEWEIVGWEDNLNKCPQFTHYTAHHIADAHNSQPKLIAALEAAVEALEDICPCDPIGSCEGNSCSIECHALTAIESILCERGDTKTEKTKGDL